MPLSPTRVQFLSQNRPGPHMGMGHYERLLFENLDAVADDSWRFGLSFSGRAAQINRAALPARFQDVSFLGVSTHRLSALPWPATQFAVARGLRATRADLWISLALSFPAPTGFSSKARRGARAIYFIHDLPATNFSDEGTIPVWAKRAAHAARFIVTPSHFAKHELMRALELPDEKFRVLLHGCEREIFHPNVIPMSAGVLAECGVRAPFVIYCGGASQRKNVPALLRAWQQVAREYSDHQLVLVGPRAPLQAMIEAQNAPRCVAVGYFGRDRLPSLIKAATCLVCPSLYEGFGLPPLEALALGVPVVATKLGALPEVVGECAEFAPLGEPDDLARALSTLLGDARRQEELARCGPARAAAFSWQENARRTLDIYREALDGALD